ncbi:hypothetical protein [Propionivibrio soli]|uniref:hypothetical protein n=1 Tax=Propionivibrio soli TaxID=2976531 RepID=UPI0021E829D5|nr:hypothetical protein [Propionivibrio soli]
MTTAFYELEFLILVFTSLLLPCGIYALLLFKKTISHWTVLFLALVLIALSGIDLVLLQMLTEKAKVSLSTLDDRFFVTELSMTLYILPAVFAGIGINLVSHVLIRHLNRAESRFDHDVHEKPTS